MVKIRDLKGYNRLKLKMILAFIIMLIPILIIGITSQTIISRYIRGRTNDFNKRNIRVTEKSLSFIRHEVNSIADHILTNKDVKILFFDDQSFYSEIVEDELVEMYRKIESVEVLLQKTIFNQSEIISKITFIPRNGEILSSKYFAKNHEILNEIKETSWFHMGEKSNRDLIWTGFHKELDKLFKEGDDYAFSLIKSLRNENTGKTNGVLVIDIKQEFLKKSIEDTKSDELTEIHYITPDNIILSFFSDNTDSLKKIKMSEFELYDKLKMKKNTLGLGTIQYKKNKHYLIFSKDEEEFAIVTLTPYSTLFKEINELNIIMGILVLISLVVALILGVKNAIKLSGLSNENLQLFNEVQEKNYKLNQSINYASKIQNAILPQAHEMKSCINDFFVIYLPKDIVSGDFYWIAEVENKKIIAVSDCTGHGVPGSLISMVGNMMLNKVVIEGKVTDPKEILEQMDYQIKLFLKKNDSTIDDGMDIGICVLDKKKKILSYSSARRPLVVTNFKNELVEYKGSKRSIGEKSRRRLKKREFERIDLKLEDINMIYMFSDGYADQNNSENSAYSRSQLKTDLLSIHEADVDIQKEILLDNLKKHQGSEAQRDDITLLGIKNQFCSK